MIVEPRIVLRADAVTPRSRKMRKVGVEEAIPVRLREVTSFAAPVVLGPLHPSGGRYDVRFNDGRLWRVPDVALANGSAVHATPEEAIESFAFWSDLRGTGSGRSPAEERFRISSSHRDSVAPLCQTYADEEILVVDGIHHERVRSPLLHLDDVARIFGSGSGVAERMSQIGGFLPAWFAEDILAVSVRDVIVARGSTLTPRERGIVAVLDVEVARPDLLALSSASMAANTDPSVFLSHLEHGIRNDLASLEFPHRESSPKRRTDAIRRMLRSSWKTSASAGCDLVEAMADTIRSSQALASKETSDRSRILLPAPPDAVFTDLAIGVRSAVGKKGVRSGWSEPSHASTDVRARIAVVDQGSRHAASAGSARYRVDDHGSWYVDSKWSQDAGSEASGPAFLHDVDLVANAWHLARRCEKTPDVHDDHLGRCMRLHGGIRPLRTDEDRQATLREFAESRLALIGGRISFRCVEPVFAVLPDGRIDGSTRSWISRSIALRAAPGDNPTFMFRLDERDEMLALCVGKTDLSMLPDVSVEVPEALAFDSALWNLRASLFRIVVDMDERAAFLGPAVESYARIERHLAAWAADAFHERSEEEIAIFAVDAGRLLEELGREIFEDIGDDAERMVARTSLDKVLGRLSIGTDATEEDFFAFAM